MRKRTRDTSYLRVESILDAPRPRNHRPGLSVQPGRRTTVRDLHHAQWADDFHHALHALLTGERQGYYEDFGSLEHLAKAYREGFVYSGQYSPFRGRRFGSSSLGAVLDPVADKLFMASAFGVVALSGRLEPYEILGVLLRDVVATIAFVATFFSHRPRAIPARAGGKAVTVAQVLTLVAFLTDSPHLRPMAWATTAIALYAIWDYYRVAPTAERRVGGTDER